MSLLSSLAQSHPTATKSHLTMASAANDSSKRRRLLGDDASPDNFISRLLSDLPGGVLTNVANYLDAPSRLLFAAALTTHQIAAASYERNSAIVGNEWTSLDFGDIEKDLAVKLNDDDIEKVLLSIDAVNRVKKLKLTNCINITGVGLEPLRGSTIIEQIDLSLVGDHQSPNISPKPSISLLAVSRAIRTYPRGIGAGLVLVNVIFKTSRAMNA
eukprot:scaffold2901_cov91-Skeletonema_dohrnii-CCMP3373.AAC.21